MAHQPTAIDAGLPPYAVALAQRARAGGLVVYAGAGLSLAEPAGLPSGAQVAQQIHARLKDAFPVLNGVDTGDLVAIADAVAALDGGEEALRFTAVQAAEFTTAVPTYGHCILALLLLEGVLDVFTTNWDNCVERAGNAEGDPGARLASRSRALRSEDPWMRDAAGIAAVDEYASAHASSVGD